MKRWSGALERSICHHIATAFDCLTDLVKPAKLSFIVQDCMQSPKMCNSTGHLWHFASNLWLHSILGATQCYGHISTGHFTGQCKLYGLHTSIFLLSCKKNFPPRHFQYSIPTKYFPTQSNPLLSNIRLPGEDFEGGHWPNLSGNWFYPRQFGALCTLHQVRENYGFLGDFSKICASSVKK